MDEVDLKIIAQLQLNSRTTFEELGKIIGYTSMGAKKRVDKLINSDLIKTTTTLNTKQLSLHPAIIFLEMENAAAMNKLLKRFRQCPRIINIFTTIGGYNIIALLVAEDQNTLESISMEKCSLRSGEGIRRSEFYPISSVGYTPHLLVREHLAHKTKTINPCNVDCRTCQRYRVRECVGCPATHYYRGSM